MEVEKTLNKKFYYVFNGRFPSEKAHSLYAAKVCESLADLGLDVILVVPKRFVATSLNYQEYFHIKKNFTVQYLPTIDLYSIKFFTKFAFIVNYLCFTVATAGYFLFKNKKRHLILSNESGPSLVLSLLGNQVVYEMHDYPGRIKWIFKFLFKFVDKILTQNEWKKLQLVEQYQVESTKIIVEPNAVDLSDFKDVTKSQARHRLNIPENSYVVLYTGHLFDWKGAEILAEAAKSLADTYQVYFVGGSNADITKFKQKYAAVKNIQVLGHKPHQEIPFYLAAADCLILPNTGKKDISKYYTSPMKLFEYLASGRPIIASDLPSIRAIVTDEQVKFFEADNQTELVKAINYVYQNYSTIECKAKLNKEYVLNFTWSKRSQRILSKIGEI